MTYSDAYSNTMLHSWSLKEIYPDLDLKYSFFVSGKKKQKGFTFNEYPSNTVYKPKPYVSI